MHGFCKQVVEVLNPLARDLKSVDTLRSELAGLQTQLSKAHAQVCMYVCMSHIDVEVDSAVI